MIEQPAPSRPNPYLNGLKKGLESVLFNSPPG